ncbi:MAG: endoglucanase [Clostridiales bacterium]|nr:endoglucanase [Candidatus Blautia equi]
MKQEKYIYKNCPIPGGGYVTSFLFGETDPKAFYIRTDVGGSYRFERESERWIPLNDDVTMEDLRETYPIALATDERLPGTLYIVSGIWNQVPSRLSVSADYGKTFAHYDLPFRAHGNLSGRGTGCKLIVSRESSDRLFYASQMDGLWKSENRGETWTKIAALPEDYLTFVSESRDGKVLLVGTAGVSTAVHTGRNTTLKNGSVEEVVERGATLYVSYDCGESFEAVPVPCKGDMEGIKMPGSVPLRVAVTEEGFYLTTSVMPKTYWFAEMAYSCDGGRILYGQVLKYPVRDGKLGAVEDITPSQEDTGISGIALIPEKNFICVSSANKRNGDSLYRSFDGGKTWEEFLYGLTVGHMIFRTSYMKPEYNGGANLIHWLSDLKINPFNENEAWFNTGTGVFRTTNLLDPEVTFSDWSDGIEETVHINCYGLPGSDVQLLDIVGDLGGFAFRNLDEACKNSFDDPDGNRYITCLNADFSDQAPEHIVITARGNWTGLTKGGLIRTDDGCKTYRRIPLPYGLSDKLDAAFRLIEEPNVNTGFVAVSEAGKHIVWSVAQGIQLPSDMVVVSHDSGASFRKVEIEGPAKGFKAFSDRVDAKLFYGFDECGRIYLSKEYGDHFKVREEKLPAFDFSLIDVADKTCVKFAAGEKGTAYISVREHGLYKLEYREDQDVFVIRKLSADGDIIYRMGLGIGRDCADYFASGKAIYIAAKLNGFYGFYRTEDEGLSYTLLTEADQHFGDINCMDGDCRTFGRFYLGTGGRGLFYGEQDKK